MSRTQFIPDKKQPQYVVVPIDDYRKLVSAAEHSEYSEIMAEIKAGAETFPLEFTMALIETDSRMREWRKFRNITQAVLAKAAGLSQGAITLIESGKRHPTVNTARKIAGALDCDIDDIF